MRMRVVLRSARAISTVLCAVSLVTATAVSGAGASGVVPPKNPSQNLWAVPAYSLSGGYVYTAGNPLPVCWAWGASYSFVPQGAAPACLSGVVAATERAHHVEGLQGFALPRNFARLTVPEQLLVVVDIERVSRGESPVLGVSARANVLAQVGARRNADPSLSGGGIAGATGQWTSNWAAAVNALDANYEWMYTDGWAGKLTFNYDCTSKRAPSCWGHRDNILVNSSRMPCYRSTCSIVMGAGYVSRGWGEGYSSYSELFVQVSGAVPALYYTWAQAVAAGARAATNVVTTTTTAPTTTTTTTTLPTTTTT
jgi:hypothetical protein